MHQSASPVLHKLITRSFLFVLLEEKKSNLQIARVPKRKTTKCNLLTVNNIFNILHTYVWQWYIYIDTYKILCTTLLHFFESEQKLNYGIISYKTALAFWNKIISSIVKKRIFVHTWQTFTEFPNSK